MLNGIWVAMIVGAILCGALFGQLDAVAEASTQSAGSAVTLAIGLVGVMAFWLGLMQMLQQAGVLRGMALALRPIMSWLFPEVPAGHPAMSMMILNIVANMLGLGNAATPFGLKAMMELNKLNKQQGTATNAMALFLAINTSQLALLPTGIIALRASLDATAAGSIVAPTLLATACSTVVAIVVTKALQGLPVFCVEPTHGGVTGPKAPLGAVAGMDTSEAEALMEVEAPPPSARSSVVV
jgi:spore maturation protein A